MSPLTYTIGFRISDELAARVDAITAELAARAHGAKLMRSDGARVALERGVEVLEQELGLRGPALRRPRRR